MELLEDTDTADFKVVAGDEGTIFHFHARVTELSSPYFTAALRSGLKEEKERSICKPNWSADVCRCLQHFMYRAEIRVPLDLVRDIYDAADEAQIDALSTPLREYQYYRGLITSQERALMVLGVGERLESEDIIAYASQVLHMSNLCLVNIEVPKEVLSRIPPDVLAAPMPREPLSVEGGGVPVLVIKPGDSAGDSHFPGIKISNHSLLLLVAERQEVANKILRIMDITPPFGDKKKATQLGFSIRFMVPFLVAAAAKAGQLTEPVKFWVHKGGSLGFYLDGGNSTMETITANGTLEELLKAVERVRALLVRLGSLEVDGEERRCSLRISAPSDAIMEKLYATQLTIGVDLAASTCYLIRPLSEMRDVLVMLTGSGGGRDRYPPLPHDEIRKVVNLTYPPRGHRI